MHCQQAAQYYGSHKPYEDQRKGYAQTLMLCLGHILRCVQYEKEDNGTTGTVPC